MINLRKFLARRRRPSGEDYARRIENEQSFYADCEDVHDLPPIFHYWADKYIRPKQEPFGFSSPSDFFVHFALRQCRQGAPGFTRMASLGAGNCDLEATLARQLVDAGQRNFTIQCVDINENMLERGRQRAAELQVEEWLAPTRGDFNHWRPDDRYDVIIANQALHHVLELEDLFGVIRQRLAPGGVFLTSDVIGRNGHRRWPEARAALEPFWAELPPHYRYNQLMRRMEPELFDHDCSTEGFEGIRAQDILPLLVKTFHFELFIPYANIVLSFIDRPFGHNYDADAEWDRDFIDRVHARDEEGMLSGELKPTQMIAVLRNEEVETGLVHPRLTPEFCIRWPEQQ